MPLYELFALTRAGVPKAQLADILRALGKQVRAARRPSRRSLPLLLSLPMPLLLSTAG